MTPAPWRVAVVGSPEYPDANRRIYARLKVLKSDWPKAAFHIVTSTTGTVAAAAVRAAKKLGMGYSAYANAEDAALEHGERWIVFWDFATGSPARFIHPALVADLYVEVWDEDCEPAGQRALA